MISVLQLCGWGAEGQNLLVKVPREMLFQSQNDPGASHSPEDILQAGINCNSNVYDVFLEGAPCHVLHRQRKNTFSYVNLCILQSPPLSLSHWVYWKAAFVSRRCTRQVIEFRALPQTEGCVFEGGQMVVALHSRNTTALCTRRRERWGE